MKTKLFLLVSVLILFFNCTTNDEIMNPEIENTIIANNFKIPDNGVFNDFVIISGENMELDSLNFYFNNKLVYEKYQPVKDSIYINIPRSLETVESNLNIYQKIRGKDSLISKTLFNLKEPKITSVKDNMTTFGESIVIYGENFDSQNYTKLYVNDINSEIIYSFKDSLKFVVPNELTEQVLSLKIETQLQEDTLSNSLNLETPQIDFVKEEVYIGEQLIIKGKRFNPLKEYGKIILNNEIEASIEYVYNSNSLKVKLPLGPYKEFEINSFKYVTASMETEFEKPLEIISNYILFNKNYERSGKIFQFQNNIYTLVSDGYPNDYYVWKLDIETQTWSKYIDTPLPYTSDFTINISNTGNLFIYTPYQNDNFTKINLLEKSIESLINFPGATRKNVVLIPDGNKVYLGKGRELNGYSSYERYQDLYSYDVNTNEWKQEITDDSKIETYNSFEFVNGTTYFKSSGDSVYEFNNSNLSFSKVYNGCSSCHTQNLFNYKNQLFLGVSNTGFIQIYNHFNFDENLSINGDFFYSYPSSFISINNNIYFYADVANYSGAHQGFYKLNPKLIDQNFK